LTKGRESIPVALITVKKRNLLFKKIVRKVAKLESETAGVLNCCANNYTKKQDCYMNNRW